MPASPATRRPAGLSRLDWALEGDVRVLIVALGGNDGAPRPAGRGTEAQSVADHRARPGAAHSGHPRRHGGAAELRPGLHRLLSSDLSGPRARSTTSRSCRFCSQGVAGIETLNQRDGIHPTAEGARIVADNVWPVLRPMLDRLHDRAARGFENSHERHRAADHSSSADDHDSSRPVRRDRRAVGQRQVDAARPARRPRCADIGIGAGSTASTSRGSTKTRSRSCAARRSASSSSSFI